MGNCTQSIHQTISNFLTMNYFYLICFLIIMVRSIIGNVSGKFLLVKSRDSFAGKRKDKVYLRGDILTNSKLGGSDYSMSERVLKEPPRRDRAPKCLQPICYLKEIRTKFYVNDDVWETFLKIGYHGIKKQIETTLAIVNKDLSRLDNGGYKLVPDGFPTKLSESDVQLADKYQDRLNNNITKPFDKHSIHSLAFTFQEAVQNLPNRNDVDVRILITKFTSSFTLNAIAEEFCICKPEWFGCIVAWSIRNLTDWSKDASVLTHEIGHTLGQQLHDEEYYRYRDTNKLVMWEVVDEEAHIWSPEARKAINNQDHSCLRGVSKHENKHISARINSARKNSARNRPARNSSGRKGYARNNSAKKMMLVK